MPPFSFRPLLALGMASCTALLLGCATIEPKVASPTLAPEGASGYQEKQGWFAKKHMVVAANPLAAEAGNLILKRGGSAVDAAIAVQMVLTLVEPQSSGIGGGAFLLHFDGKRVQAFDGRETAPAAADQNLFMQADGTPMSFYEAVIGGRSVGVPGVLRMLEDAHRLHGKLPWAMLFEPAIGLATEGFEVSPRLATLLSKEDALRQDPVAAAYFYDASGKPRPVGYLLKNPELAATLRTVAKGGADAFYQGEIAQSIVDKVRAHVTNPGLMTIADLDAYRSKQREPLCSEYKLWRLCGMPPPSSGALTIAQMLGILAHTEIQDLPPDGNALQPQAVHLFSEAGRLAYADRNRYIADPDFVPLPGGGMPMLDKTYLAQRAALIGERSMGKAVAGQPFAQPLALGSDPASERPSTSHMSIADAYGNVLAMTTTIENGFGARQMVGGFLLNNQLTDFSSLPADEHGPIANRVEAGKRPRSSMAPTLVFEKSSGKLVMALGSPGGSAIINYVAKTLVGTMDWQRNVQQAISLPNIGSRNGPTELELGRVSPELIAELKARGHDVVVEEQTSGLHGLMRLNIHGEELWFGGADPRREGIAAGE
ncbi:MAG: gamma-glutamyltransferase [Oxalicibacterium faecigallinarum]|uniref:gamma-glutamyltransferase n=1 Tax=Oxalicibacterium faecigallinarum TaxID=573741 RepID=UPI002807C036|nr:gamma-glutamyltransferase [Oxalicibacterium faecigallinarum]MDQ7968777.1 gamma-glutamyltransferase [Oxalicibacterium faecigallinarum]